MIKSNSFIASSFSTATKTISNFGLFFLIGHFYEEIVFSHYIFVSVIATFLATLVDMGYSTKIVVDFTNKKQSQALYESYKVRFIPLSVVIVFMVIASILNKFNLLFFLIFINSVLLFWLESFSFNLRFKNKYWSEFFFTLLVHFFPFVILSYFLYLNIELEIIFFVFLTSKLFVFFILYLKLERNYKALKQLKGEFVQCFKYSIDSISMNVQPLAQIYLAKLFLTLPEFIIFGYAQKIIQAFNTLFSAVNNVFYPGLASNWFSKKVVKTKIRNFFIIANVAPALLLLFFCLHYFSLLNFPSYLSKRYVDILGVLGVCGFIVFIRFNNAVLGCILILSGMQKMRAKINLFSFVMEVAFIFFVCSIYPFSDVIFGVIIASNSFVLISYMWNVYNDEDLSSIIFDWKKNKVK